MEFLKKAGRVALVCAAIYGLYALGAAIRDEVRNYRAMQIAVAEMHQYLAQPIGTRSTEKGDAPVSRADVLAFVAAQTVANAGK